MKRLFLILACFTFSLFGMAQSQNVDLKKGGIGGSIGGPAHAPAMLPNLCYEETAFTLSVPYDIDDLEIVITDANGTILYYNKVDVVVGNFTFYVPSVILADMALVELYYGTTYLYGDL